VVSYSVGQRRQELGIRMALGASAGHVLARVLAGTLALTAAGIALGLAGALALSRLLGSLLYAVPPSDPATLAGMALVLTAASLAAAAIPALRATRIDIAQVLRS
jgi:putative ABC transport system permease protein